MQLSLIMLVGLTGVGKSTAVEALHASGEHFSLLPNRREITDRMIIPEVQRDRGETPHPVTDRLERFELTRAYRDKHPGGVVHALDRMLVDSLTISSFTLVFDNLRGVGEVRAANESIPHARFVVLDAPHEVRLRRLIDRNDAFDRVAGSDRDVDRDLLQTLKQIDGADALFDLEALAALDVPADKLVAAVEVVSAEQRNYDMDKAIAYLETLPPERYLYLDTSRQSPREIAEALRGWL